MNYSQNNEQSIIESYFNGYVGTFADIGANDGITLSNTYALHLKGWEGFYFEPSPTAFAKLQKNIMKKAKLHNMGIGKELGELTFYDSDEHLKKGDIALLSTFEKKELKRWGNTQVFTETKAMLITWDMAFEMPQQLDLISIDAEGMDYDILAQINLNRHSVKMLIIEYNNDKALMKAMDNYCLPFGLKVHAVNHENIIYVR